MWSLLNAARDGTNKEAWRRLVGLCAPLLHAWLRCQHLQHADAEDLVQETLTILAREAPTLRPNGNPRMFRSWLRKVLINRLLNFRRAQRVRSICRSDSELLDQLAESMDDSRDSLTRRGGDVHDDHIARQVMERIEPEFQPKTWQAFRRVALEGDDPEVVAAELHLSLSSVYVAKCRVLKRLRQEAKKSATKCKELPADALIEV
jgi:RNA polymerase sigma-70 factor (ECF subfamily)